VKWHSRMSVPQVYIPTLHQLQRLYTLETWDKLSERGLLCPATLIKNHTGFQQNQNCSQKFLFVTFFLPQSPLNLVQINANGNDALISNQKFSVGTGKYRGGTVVKVPCYKSAGRWFDPSWCQWIFH